MRVFLLVLVAVSAVLQRASRGSKARATLPAIYGTKKDACVDCFRAYPQVSGVGSERHGCKVGQCFLHDPYTQPAGGVAGLGPDWKDRKIDYCITRDNVSWFTRCRTLELWWCPSRV